MNTLPVTIAFQGAGTTPSSPPKTDAATVLLVAGALIAVVIGATIILMLVRAKVTEASRDADQTGPLMDQLRELRDQGKLTEDEYQTARDRLRHRLAISLKHDHAPAKPDSKR